MSRPSTSAPLDPSAEWRAVAAVGRLTPDADEIERALAPLPADPDVVEQLLLRVRKARVVALAERNLRETGETAPLHAPLRDAVAEARRARETVLERVLPIEADIVRRATAAGGHVVKGLAVRGYYREPHLRHVGDIDLHFDDLETALPFLGGLRAEGWEWDHEEFPWLKWDDAGRAYGQWAMLLEIGFPSDPIDHGARIDAHVGPYSVGHLGLLPLERFREVELDGMRVSATAPEETAALVAAHASGNFYLTMKDVNDFVELARSEPLDWERVRRLAHVSGVEAELGQLAWWARALYGTDVPDAVATRGDAPLRTTAAPPRDRMRALHVARLTYRQERRHGVGARGLARVPRALAEYVRDLDPRVGRARPSPIEPESRRRWVCWRMVPDRIWRELPDPGGDGEPRGRSESLGGGLELVHAGGSDGAAIVRLGNDVFVPTVWGPVEPRTLALARRVADDAGSSSR